MLNNIEFRHLNGIRTKVNILLILHIAGWRQGLMKEHQESWRKNRIAGERLGVLKQLWVLNEDQESLGKIRRARGTLGKFEEYQDRWLKTRRAWRRPEEIREDQEQNFSEAVEAVNHSQEEDIYPWSRIRRRHITMRTVPLARKYDLYLNYWDASSCCQLPLHWPWPCMD